MKDRVLNNQVFIGYNSLDSPLIKSFQTRGNADKIQDEVIAGKTAW